MSERNVSSVDLDRQDVYNEDARLRGIKEHTRFELESAYYYSSECVTKEQSYRSQRLRLMYGLCALMITCGGSIAFLAYAA